MFRFTTLALCSLICIPAARAASDPSADPFASYQIRTGIDAAAPEQVAMSVPSALPVASRTRKARVQIHVSISQQTMDVMVDGALRYHWPVSTARKGYVTPTGTWTPYRMHTMWHSHKYDNAAMPYSIFYHGGYAIHATPYVKHLGHPASHGCVRLHPGNAKLLFSLASQVGQSNLRVTVTP